MHDVDFDTAMRIICEAKGLAYRDINGVDCGNSQRRRRKSSDVEIYKLNYQKAEDMQKMLTTLVSDGGKIAFDPISNSILFSGSAIDGAKVRNAVKALDKVTQQVTLEAKIISISRTDESNWASPGTGIPCTILMMIRLQHRTAFTTVPSSLAPATSSVISLL
jgi:hypothetical protein